MFQLNVKERGAMKLVDLGSYLSEVVHVSM